MKTNSRIKINIIICCLLAIFAFTIRASEVNADISVNFDGFGSPAAGTGAGASGSVVGDYALQGCWALKVNLVKIEDSGPKWAAFYYLFDDITSSGKTNHQLFTNTKWAGRITNVITSDAGGVGVVGQLYSDRYATTAAFGADIKTLSGLGISSNFFGVSGTSVMLTFDVSKLKSSVVGADKTNATDTFYKIFYTLLNTNNQKNAPYWPSVDMSGIGDWTALKTSMENTPGKWSSLSDYRIIFEPIYRWKFDDASKDLFIWTTMKSGAQYLNDRKFGGVNKDNYLENCYTGEDHGSIKAAGASDKTLAGMTNPNSGRGYAIVNIVGEASDPTCDPATSCCYDSSGTYKETPASPPANAGTYKCPGAVNADNTCSVAVVSCGSGGPGDGTCEADEEGPYYNYYMFTAGTEKSYLETVSEPMRRTGANTNFSDSKIFEELIKNTSGTEDYSLDYIRVLEEASGKIDITGDNILDFYTKLKRTRETVDFYYQSGNDFYVTHSQFCDDAGNCWPTEPLYKEPSYYVNRSVYASNHTITRLKNGTNTGFLFEIVRTFVRGFDAQTFISSTPDKSGTEFFHPAEYRVAYCVAKKTGPDPDPVDCKDDVTPATCYDSDTETHAVFHESNNLKACTIPVGNNSGFTMINDSDFVSNSYCSVSCKDDLDIYLPGTKYTAAGQYFLLNNHVPEITATRTCVTSEIKYSQFQNDLSAFEDDNNLPRKYNEYQDYLDVYKHFKAGTTYTTPTPTISYSSETVSCRVTDSDPAEYRTYIKESYKYNGKSYTYVAGHSDCDVDESGTIDGRDDSSPMSFTSRTGKATTTWDGSDPIIDSGPKTTNTGLGEVTPGVAICTYNCGTWSNPRTCKTSYQYEDWTLYTYTGAPNYSQTGIRFDQKTGHWEENTVCSGSYGAQKYRDAIDYWTNNYYGYTSSAKSTYFTELDRYKTVINDYNVCYSWTDRVQNTYDTYPSLIDSAPELNVSGPVYSAINYAYNFKPKVTFKYSDPDKRVFTPMPYEYNYGNSNEVEQDGFNVKYTYWRSGTTANDTYSNGNGSIGPTLNSGQQNSTNAKGMNAENYQLLDCSGTTCKKSTNKTLNTYFYSSAYVRKDETVTYTYHLPRVYTLIASGTVGNLEKNPPRQAHLVLEEDAVPININTDAADNPFDYTISITNVSDALRRGEVGGASANDAAENTEDMITRFENGTAKTVRVMNASASDYVCHYEVTNDIYIPKKRFNFFYRIIDPYDINPVPRELGYNWADSRGSEVQDRMREGEENYQVLANNGSRDKFVFTLTPAIMKSVRTYNSERAISDQGYADWDLKCNDYTMGGYHCYSNFLSCIVQNGVGEVGVSGAPSCASIFGDTVNRASGLFYNNTYDYTLHDLNTNRQILINKQNNLDESYDGRVSRYS